MTKPCEPNCNHNHKDATPVFAGEPSAQTQKALSYAKNNMRKTLEDLSVLTRIPSVSLPHLDGTPVALSAEATAEIFRTAGLEKVEVLSLGTGIHPYVYGEWLHKPGAPTMLLYAHHDVQPAGDLNKWCSEPFTPTEREGRLYGRGTADDKAGILVHVAAIAAYLKTSGELPVNVKVIIEGEEEIGSNHLGTFLREHKQKLSADGIIVTDCVNVDSGIPSLTTGLRGMIGIDIEVEALQSSVHSGIWGGILPDSSWALSQILSTLTDVAGNILIPGLEQDVSTVTVEEQSYYEALPLRSYARRASGLYEDLPFRVPEKQFAEHLWRKPSLTINAIQSGDRKQAGMTIQNAAWARLSIRTVPHMREEDIIQKTLTHIQRVCPAGYHLKTDVICSARWWSIPNKTDRIYEIAMRSLEKGYGQPAQWIGSGFSIPFIEPLTNELGGIPALLIGVEDPYTLAHSENESLLLSDFEKAILGQVHMFGDLAALQKA